MLILREHGRLAFRLTVVWMLFCLALTARAAEPDNSLDQGFVHPPRSAGVRCFWWWLNGNVTEEAISRDLEAMHAKGFSGALIFDAGGAEQRGNRQVPAGPLFASPPWRKLFAHAVREADRLGLELSLNIQSGWNLGGPLVTPEMAAKTLTWSRIQLQGPANHREKLPPPKSQEGFYRDVAVLAYPVKETAAADFTVKASTAQPDYPAPKAVDGNDRTFWVSDSDRPGQGPREDHPEWLEIRFARPTAVAGLQVLGRTGYGPRRCRLEVAQQDGGSFSTIQVFDPADGKIYSARFQPVTGLAFRLVIRGAYDVNSPSAPRNVQVANLQLLDAEQKSLVSAAGARPIRDLEAKAAFRELGMSAPDCRFLLTDVPAVPGEEDTTRDHIVNLTDRLDADGTLRWQVPPGAWVVFRFGYTLNGVHVSTSSANWQGRVLDYLDSDCLQIHWDQVVEPILAEIGPLAGTTLKYLATDSWECGGANWTSRFVDEFQKRRGYDPTVFLPVIAGVIVDSRNVSNRFLADFRKTIADCIADNHYRVFAELARRHNLGIHPESGGPHAGPFDAMKCLGRNDIVMGEFWVPSAHRPQPVNRFYVKQSASVAHTYGRRLVGAEAFTSIGPHWDDVLWRAQKPSFDHEACSGLNLVFLHTFTCSPSQMGLPGQEYFAGTHCNPNVTWWDQSDGFFSYLHRCQYLFQQGRFQADVLSYYGDHVPNLVRLKEDDPAGALPGYDYDVINEEVLLDELAVQDGDLVLNGRMRYRVLVLPDHRVLSLAVLRKVADLVRDGAIVIGPKPEQTVSLVEFPASETELKQLADALWGEAIEPTGQRPYGKGRVVWGKSARQVLGELGIPADWQITAPTADAQFDVIHYTIDPAADLYFVCNQTERPVQAQATFRISGRQPELWDAVTGDIRAASAFGQQDGRTTVPLEFGPYGSLFVVFRRPIPPDRQGPAPSNYPAYQTVTNVEGPWQVVFSLPAGPLETWNSAGSPRQSLAVQFDELASWTRHPNPQIACYSGTAVYTNTFSLPEVQPDRRYVLDLGELGDIGIARVHLNGEDLGVVWTKPFGVEISRPLRPGENQLKIEAVNSWLNRLVGDRDLPAERRITRTNIRIQPNWKLLDSGLLGPVTILKDMDQLGKSW
ncbi:MAG: discoidin domain-containing protein [Sedimentisphaerales bacterium]|nr:discoidin domain-containing protein [Sedimentisphaerales bacterium]